MCTYMRAQLYTHIHPPTYNLPKHPKTHTFPNSGWHDLWPQSLHFWASVFQAHFDTGRTCTERDRCLLRQLLPKSTEWGQEIHLHVRALYLVLCSCLHWWFTAQGTQTRSRQIIPLLQVLYSLSFLVTSSTSIGSINQGLIIFRKNKIYGKGH